MTQLRQKIASSSNCGVSPTTRYTPSVDRLPLASAMSGPRRTARPFLLAAALALVLVIVGVVGVGALTSDGARDEPRAPNARANTGIPPVSPPDAAPTSPVTGYQLPVPDPSTANPSRRQIEQEFQRVLRCLADNGVEVTSSDLKITKYDVSTHLGLSNTGAAAKDGRQDSVQRMCSARFVNLSQQWTNAAGPFPKGELETAFRDCVAAKGVARDTDIKDMDQVNVFVPCMRQARADVLGVR